MDTRIALKRGTLLRFRNHDHGQVTYKIEKEIGRGGLGLVYDAVYTDNEGCRNTVRIKECYPFSVNLKRQGNELLPVNPSDAAAFLDSQEKMKVSYRVNKELFYTNGLTNLISNTIDLYTANRTIYVASTYLQGQVLSCETAVSVKDAVSIVKSVARAVGKIHDRDFLYLDLKPDNIFILDGVREIVQLFDFDTLISLSDIKARRADRDRISCTRGFAAPEQQGEKLLSLGRHTDVYGVGALLFYLLFRRAPDALDCGPYAEYRFSDCRFAGPNYQDRLFQVLPDFFHHTLTNYPVDRYQDMRQVVRELEEIEKYADTVVPFLISSQVSAPPVLEGREQELKVLEEWLDRPESSSLFVTGMGGIGKSTLVRGLIAEHRSDFDAVLYLYYKGSIQEMIADDMQMRINIVERMEEESTEDYFRRKLRIIRDLAAGKRILLVVDNFAGMPDADFVSLLDIGWKVITVSRAEVPKTGYDTLKLQAIGDRESLYTLFECYAGRALAVGELPLVDDMINRVFGHTLALQLIARQVECSHISVEEAAALLREKGFAHMAPEKVDYVKDRQLYQDRVCEIIDALFQAGQLSVLKRAILKVASLFSASGVDIGSFTELITLSSKDEINELVREGWMQREGKRISLHPVIREVVWRWEWTEENRTFGLWLLLQLWKRIELESETENYPLNRLGELLCLKRAMETDDNVRNLIQNYVSRSGIEGEVALERIERIGQWNVTDRHKLRVLTSMAEEVLDACAEVETLRNTDVYDTLLYSTIRNVPPDREDYILRHGEELLSEWEKRTKHMAEGERSGLEEDERASGEGGNCQEENEKGAVPERSVLDLYERVVTIYGKQKNFRAAELFLQNAERAARSFRSPSLMGQYYMIAVGYYYAVIDGDYATGAKSRDIRKMEHAIDRATRRLRKDLSDEGRLLYMKALLAKLYVLVCTCSRRRVKIRRLFRQVREIAEQYALKCAQIWQEYYLVKSWYYTLIDRDYEEMTACMAQAEEIVSVTADSALVRIERLILPWMHMLADFGEYGKAAELLKNGIQMCETEDCRGVVPYIREKVYLYACLLDMYYLAGDFVRCREVLGVIDELNRENEELGIEKVIEAGYREEICRRSEDPNSPSDN